MKRICVLLSVILLFCFVACGQKDGVTVNADGSDVQVTDTTTPTPAPHSSLYVENLSVEDVIVYFNEICLDAEFVNEGNPNVVQKWTAPIYYSLNGNYTAEDLAKLTDFVAWLNTMEGFPGMHPADNNSFCNLRIYFCDRQSLVDRMGDNYYGMDGGVTFWYENNEIYDAIICYCTEINQYTRNSVILEEIYNGLGPVQDTDLRMDSIAYSGFSEPQALTDVDELILKLLYHPDIQCGMDAEQCEAVIRQLYY